MNTPRNGTEGGKREGVGCCLRKEQVLQHDLHVLSLSLPRGKAGQLCAHALGKVSLVYVARQSCQLPVTSKLCPGNETCGQGK